MSSLISPSLSNGIRAGSNSDSDSQLTIEIMLEWLAYLNSNKEKSQKSAISMEQKQTRIEQKVTDETLVENPNHASDPVLKIGVEQKETSDPNQKWEARIQHLVKASDEQRKAIHDIGDRLEAVEKANTARFDKLEMMMAQLTKETQAEKGGHETDTPFSVCEPGVKDPGKWKGECEVEPDFDSKMFLRDSVAPTSVITDCESSELELGSKSINVLPTSVIEQTKEERIGEGCGIFGELLWKSCTVNFDQSMASSTKEGLDFHESSNQLAPNLEYNESVVSMDYSPSKVTGDGVSETNEDVKKQPVVTFPRFTNTCWRLVIGSRTGIKSSENTDHNVLDENRLRRTDGSLFDSPSFEKVNAEITPQTDEFFLSDAEDDPDGPNQGYFAIRFALKALQQGRFLIVVDGENDDLIMFAIITSPKDIAFLVKYGFGIVKKATDPKIFGGLGSQLPLIIHFPDVMKNRLECLQYAFDVFDYDPDLYNQIVQLVDKQIVKLQETLDEEKLKKLHELSKQTDIYERLSRSLAPNIWDLDDIKKGLLCQLFGGSAINLTSGTNFRGDINTLLVDNPGISKSQLLQYIHKLSPCEIYTSGHGSESEYDYPMVLAQIPTCNVREVYEQSIFVGCQLVWPKDRMLVQVLYYLDDVSIQQLIQAEVNKWSQKGVNISYRHRLVRTTYKAGNLKSAMSRDYVDEYEFVAISDADFQPTPDFIKLIVPHFKANPEFVRVQARWTIMNKDENLLNRLQNINLCFHCEFEQQVNVVFFYFFGFNGTAGVWRIKALEESNVWLKRTTVEDMDIVVCAHLHGWKFNYFNDVKVLCEVPESYEAYKKQQFMHTSSYKGAEVTENRKFKEMNLDGDSFMKDIESMLGTQDRHKQAHDASDGSEESSNIEFDDFEDEYEGEWYPKTHLEDKVFSKRDGIDRFVNKKMRFK